MEITPPAPPESEAPASPIEPTPEVASEPEVTPAPEAPTESELEWKAAEEEVLGTPAEAKPEEPVTPEVPAPSEPETPTAPESTPPATPETPAPEVKPEPSQADLEAIAQRVMSRNSQASIESKRSEIKSKIMPPVPELKASDGLPITSAKDLETIEDPRTPGVAFTPAEAARIFNDHQQSIKAIETQAETRATQIAEVNQAVEDEAAIVLDAFKDVFAANPELQKSMYQAYEKTLKISPEGFIEEAPVSIIEFYNSALAPYVKMQETAAAAPASPPPAPAPVAADKSKQRQDRSDIYKPSGNPLSKEEQEWADAEREVLGVN